MRGRAAFPPALIFAVLTAAIVACSVFSLTKAVSWIGRSFPGFLVYHPPYVGSFSSQDWPGKKAGVRYLERILAVDDRPVFSGSDVLQAVAALKPGAPVRYTLAAKGLTREVAVPVRTFELKDFIIVFLPTFICGLAIFAVAVVVYVLKPNTATSWVFLVMCFCLGIYGITGFEIQSSYATVRLHYLALALFPFSFFHLGAIFPERKQILTRHRSLEYLIYLPPLALGLAYQAYFSTFPEIARPGAPSLIPAYPALSAFARVFTLFGFLSLIGLVLHAYFRSSTIPARQRARIMIFGVSIAFLPMGVLMFLAQRVSLYFPFNFIPILSIFFPVFIAYSIVRHNMFDADVIIRRTVGYVLVTTAVIGAYVGVSVGLNVLLGKYQPAQSQAFPLIFTLAVILAFNPLRNRVQRLVDRVFFRKEYDAGAIVEKFGIAMSSLLDLGLILRQLIQTFKDEMFINTSSVMLLSPAGTGFQVRLADGEGVREVAQLSFPLDDPLVRIVEGRKKELTKNDLLEEPKFRALSAKAAAGFDALRASLMVPMVFQNKVVGLLSLGEKKSGKAFNREDIELLRTLASQGAVAVKNAVLFQENLENQRMEEELSIARDLQMSMLPAVCPKVSGAALAADSLPAREVGGDFYDFIEMGGEILGIVIGDVSGKGVSSALIMSASRSIFRILSEEPAGVGEIMVRASHRTRKDIKSGMFVALLYAVYDSRDKTLSLCSAGQTQPVHISSRTGAARLVETEGDTFPLGIVADADYRETRVSLESGDKIVFYTDGLVEAMNEQGELFGFERLLVLAQEAQALPAEALLKAVLGAAGAFAGNAAQHDDLTVIVLEVSG